MILRNWINSSSFRAFGNYTIACAFKSTAGDIFKPSSFSITNAIDCNEYNNTGTTGASISVGKIGIVLGSDTTTPTVDDYKIDNPILTLTSGSAYNNISTTGTWATNAVIECTQTVINGTANNITVSEVGLFGTGSGDTACRILFTKDLITPVTIAPNETKTFIISVNLEESTSNISVQ